MLVLCLLLLSPLSSNQENTTVSNPPKEEGNKTLNGAQVTEPRPVFRNESIELSIKPFKPSPQFNSAFQPIEETVKSRTSSFTNNNWPSNEWDENRNSKVKFPSTSVERPYQFDTGIERYPPITNSLDYPFSQTASPRPARPPDSLWKKIFGFNSKQKTFYDNEEEEYPPYHHDYYDQPHEYHHQMQQYRNKISPIKKILKILAAIIPIGFLLSALTPTIVAIAPMNSSTTRINRKDDIVQKLMPSLSALEKLRRDGCEEKVFCELILNAMLSKNAEDHVKNLLNNFVHRKGEENRDSTIKILEAVKHKDCSPLICHMLEDPI